MRSRAASESITSSRKEEVMADQDLQALFAGSNDEGLLFALYCRIYNPSDDILRTYCDAWEAFELVHSDGFEMLIGQDTPLEDYSAALAKIGMPQAEPIFSRVLALMPPELLLAQNEKALWEHVHSRFEELKELAYEFYDRCAVVDFVSLAAHYVRQHREVFSPYVSRRETDAEPDAD
jgi:hypothetical protein